MLRTRKSLVVLAMLSALSACAEGESKDAPWQGYATNKGSGNLEWFFSSYASRSDCEHGTRTTISSSPSYYREPSGCAYSGGNKFAVYAINLYSMGSDMLCLARSTDLSARKDGTLYSPVLKGHPAREGKTWYCVL
jgi:hypothetical protein